MTWFRLGPAYTTGVEALDDQHQHMVTMINLLKEAIDLGRGKDVADALLAELKDYAVNHFSNEEAIMLAAGNLPHTEEHLEEHRRFLEAVVSFESAKGLGCSVHLDILNYLKFWLVVHIRDMDIRTFRGEEDSQQHPAEAPSRQAPQLRS